MCTCELVPECSYAHHMSSSMLEGGNRVSEPLELELQAVMSYYVGTGYPTWVFHKSGKFF